jgi:hypothetical protein
VSYSFDDNIQTAAPRIGSILVAWAGGGTRFTVNQGGAFCRPSETFQEPASGDKWLMGIGAGCLLNTTYASDASWLYAPSTFGGMYLSIFVDPNPGGPRTGHITLSPKNGNLLYGQYTFVQAGQ